GLHLLLQRLLLRVFSRASLARSTRIRQMPCEYVFPVERSSRNPHFYRGGPGPCRITTGFCFKPFRNVCIEVPVARLVTFRENWELVGEPFRSQSTPRQGSHSETCAKRS